MLSGRKIRRKIRSVNNIKKITRAMEMVSAAKLKKVQGKLIPLRPFAGKLKQALVRLLSDPVAYAGLAEYAHLVAPRTAQDNPSGITVASGPKAVIVLASNKGLCGSYNANIIKTAANFISQQNNPEIIAIGRKVLDYFQRRGYNIKSSYLHLPPDLSLAMVKDMIGPFLKEMSPDAPAPLKEIWVIYSEFINAMVSKVRVKKILPIEIADLAEEKSPESVAGKYAASDCLFEPAPAEITKLLLPRYIDTAFYRILLESMASEHSARMLAMRSATENASEVIDHLTLTYNKARQAGITKELLDIVGGAEAMR
jgi:F-type H+-transporting ATPase subunit gamma